jgi:hypothetical protein
VSRHLPKNSYLLSSCSRPVLVVSLPQNIQWLATVHWSTFRPVAYCSTDASNVASCGVCPFSSAWVHAWTDKQAWHINIRELWAVYHSLLTWGLKWDNHDVAVATDNTSVLAWINSGTSKSPQAMALICKIFWIKATRNMGVRAVWVPSAGNPAADAGSRLLFSQLEALTGIPPSALILSGSQSVLNTAPPLSPLPPIRSDHLQTLLKLKGAWYISRSREYSLH